MSCDVNIDIKSLNFIKQFEHVDWEILKTTVHTLNTLKCVLWSHRIIILNIYRNVMSCFSIGIATIGNVRDRHCLTYLQKGHVLLYKRELLYNKLI